jgi:flagellar assembly protein FliH
MKAVKANPLAAVRKFTFDNDFDRPKAPAPKVEPQVVAEAPPPPPPPTFSEEELAAAVAEARKTALAEGTGKGKAEAGAQIERQTASALNAIANHFAKIEAEVKAAVGAMRETTVELSLAMVRRLFPEFARQHGLDEVKALLGRNLDTLRTEPRFTVRVAAGQADLLRGEVETLAQSRGYEGRIVVTADESLKAGDCRIEWSQGGMIRSADEIWKAIEAAMEQASISTEDTAPAVDDAAGR